MARTKHRLRPLQVKALTKPGLYADGGGLYLRVAPGGTRGWIFRWARDGRTRDMGLGSVDAVSLAKAREKADAYRAQAADGIDPIEARKGARLAAAVVAARTSTFEEAARSCVKARSAGWRDPKHEKQWVTTLETYAFPHFASVPVDQVDVAMVMKALEPIWTEKPETASRVRGRIETVLDWAAARGYRSGDNPARWRGHLQSLLPPAKKVRRV
ncbi:MAG: tyrosine-type recombinase/integrase [Alphaproteobacteria bacterium]